VPGVENQDFASLEPTEPRGLGGFATIARTPTGGSLSAGLRGSTAIADDPISIVNDNDGADVSHGRNRHLRTEELHR
jgi:hypothetical protein